MLSPKEAKAKRKAQTASRLKEQTESIQNEIRGLLKAFGPNGKPNKYDGDGNKAEESPRRDWSSRNMDEDFIIVFLSMRFGLRPTALARARLRPGWCEDRYQDALRRAEPVDFEECDEARILMGEEKKVEEERAKRRAKRRPTPALREALANRSSEPMHRQPATSNPARKDETAVSPSVSLRVHNKATQGGKKVTKEDLAELYQDYENAAPEDRAAALAGLHTALYAYAPMCGRRKDCERLLEKYEIAIEPDDLLSGFVISLIDRLGKGQYSKIAYENSSDESSPKKLKYSLDSWVRMVWQRWYFPEIQTQLYQEQNLEMRVNEQDNFDKDEEPDLSVGEIHLFDVSAQFISNSKSMDGVSDRLRVARIVSDLDNPETFWGKLNGPTKAMIRAMAAGKMKKDAAHLAGVKPRRGQEIMAELRKQVQDAGLTRAQPKAAPIAKSGGLRIMACADMQSLPNVFDISAAALEGDREGNIVSYIRCRRSAWTADELGELLSLSRKHIYKMAKAGRMPSYRVGGAIRFDPRATADWLEAKAA